MRRRPPSELECFTLGLIWQLGPCSPYEVRRHMQASPSTQWSGSAGSIYPLMSRLEKAGLLSGKAARNGARRRREYAVTPAGLAALRAWVGPPLSPEVITVAHDPLRSRARFLELLSPPQRLAWVKAARAALDEVERRVLAWDASNAGLGAGARIASASGSLDVNSRRAWLGLVEQAVDPHAPPRQNAPRH